AVLTTPDRSISRIRVLIFLRDVLFRHNSAVRSLLDSKGTLIALSPLSSNIGRGIANHSTLSLTRHTFRGLTHAVPATCTISRQRHTLILNNEDSINGRGSDTSTLLG